MLSAMMFGVAAQWRSEKYGTAVGIAVGVLPEFMLLVTLPASDTLFVGTGAGSGVFGGEGLTVGVTERVCVSTIMDVNGLKLAVIMDDSTISVD